MDFFQRKWQPEECQKCDPLQRTIKTSFSCNCLVGAVPQAWPGNFLIYCPVFHSALLTIWKLVSWQEHGRVQKPTLAIISILIIIIWCKKHWASSATSGCILKVPHYNLWELPWSSSLFCTEAHDPDSSWLKSGFATSNASVRADLPNLLVCI